MKSVFTNSSSLTMGNIYEKFDAASPVNRERSRDRFVVSRASLPERGRRMTWNSGHDNDEEIWSTKYLQKKKYINFLDEVFNLPPLKPQQREDAWSWPCVPRKRRYLSSADSILDLPTYRFAAFPQLLDWSTSDVLVAALGRHYHTWSWRTQTGLGKGVTFFNVHCCKFDPRGEYLLLGTHVKCVEVHDDMGKCRFVLRCECPHRACSITAIDWSPTGNSFVTGCSTGAITAMSRNNYVIQSRPVLNQATLVVRISPNARFVATAGLGGDMVVLLVWPQLNVYSYLPVHMIVKDLAWHPWHSALLGVAFTGDSHSSLALWEPASHRHRVQRLGRGAYSVDSMLFNHRTGELMLSLWNMGLGESSTKCSQLVVMSDFDTVVDQWGEGRVGLDRVRTMVFSPDGTKIATATVDEDLIIWNFLPKDYQKMKTCKNFSLFPQFLDKIPFFQLERRYSKGPIMRKSGFDDGRPKKSRGTFKNCSID